MLALAVQNHDRSYATPTSYWLTQLDSKTVATDPRRLEDPLELKRKQRRRLRYKQTHPWWQRVYHSIKRLLSPGDPELTMCY